MRKIVLYIAMSLDGYIADNSGGVTWISGDGSDPESLGSYGEFSRSVDTVILGYKTYHQIITELSPNIWVYEDKMSYVITHRQLKNQKNIVFTGDLQGLITRLKSEEGKDIWICGGSEIVNHLIKLNLIDRFRITLVPTLLGAGIRLFDSHKSELQLKLISRHTYNGMIELTYDRRS